MSDVLAAKTKIFQLRVDSLYNKAMRTLQNKNTRYEDEHQIKDTKINVIDNVEFLLKENCKIIKLSNDSSR